MWRDSESDQDFLNFGEVADQIAALVSNPSLLPISVGLFGGWGTGKSTILGLVEAQIPKGGSGAPIIVDFDAWLYQGFDDARASLMEVVAQRVLEIAEGKKTFVDKAKSLAARVNYFRAIGLAADFGVGMALGIPPGLLTSAGTALSSIFSGSGTAEDKKVLEADANLARKGISDLIRPAEKRTPPKEILEFRREFGELLEGFGTTLILFIDNLDRCLPDAAIGTLEAVRLFLFMPRTAFIIAADESMIRHSVAKHFGDLQTSHVRDYLDKVIQVPIRVPQVGPEDLRAYMYSLFVSRCAPGALTKVQQHLSKALGAAWNGVTFTKDETIAIATDVKGLADLLAIADRLAPILASAPNVQGNPRIVKRLLNAVFLRRLIAERRNMNVDIATLAKLAVFERCTDEKATLALYRIAFETDKPEMYFLPPEKLQGGVPTLPEEWKPHEEFISRWRRMEPLFGAEANVRAALYLSRDVMVPAATRSGVSQGVRDAISALIRVQSVNSPVGKQLIEKLSAPERRIVMDSIIDSMRSKNWSEAVPGIHGAIILATESPEAASDLKAFLSTLQKDKINKGIVFLLRNAGLIGAP